MLNWLIGRQAVDANQDDENRDTPETPAPLFAARALKSAIFGTPGFRDEDELERPQQAVDVGGELRSEAHTPGESSPTKPQGILLTPGTATVRRKTVSFGVGVIDNGGKDAIGKSGVPNDFPGKFPSPYTPKAKVDGNLEAPRQTALSETLEAARDGRPRKSRSIKSVVSAAATTSSFGFERIPTSVTQSNIELQSSNVALLKTTERGTMGTTSSSNGEDLDGDMTLDLDEPHSQSGRYWKSEYDRYHEEAKLAMEKLVKYKQLAKSYARKKDSEAIDLVERLKEEQQKVVSMEARVSELAVQMSESQLNGRANENHDLMKDLARQTALAREYSNQVDEFQTALQESRTILGHQTNRKSQRNDSTTMFQIPAETSLELNKAGERIAEINALQDEVQKLRLNLSTAEKRASKLQNENAKLSRDLAKLGEELDKSERRCQSAEKQNPEPQILLQTLHKDYDTLKELAKSQRRDAEDLLKKRHNQVVRLKKEIRLLKGEAAASIPKNADQVIPHTNGEIVTCVAHEVANRREPNRVTDAEDLMSFETPPRPEGCRIGLHGKLEDDLLRQRARETAGVLLPLSSTVTRNDDRMQTKASSEENNYVLDSKIPTPYLSNEKRESMNQEDACKKDENIPKRNNSTSKHTPLFEIINNAHPDDSPTRNQSLPASQLSASFRNRFSSLSLNSPGPVLPSPMPSFPRATNQRKQDRHGTDSPRPSMFNIPSSPPKGKPPRPRSSGTDSITGRNGHAPSSRMSSMSSRARTALPSDRAAAAKARLEQKIAEKKRAQEMAEEKENVCL